MIAMNAFTIKDIENLSGIKAHTIRIWEQRYTFLKPSRTSTNIRYYNCDELKTVLNIALLNKYGYKISHLDRMSEQEVREKLVSLSHSEAQQERMVNDLVHFMVDLDMVKFESMLDNLIAARGIDKVITQLIFPFLDKIGILWVTNHINPAQEHLVSNLIRQKLVAGIEHAVSYLTVNKKVLLFLPEGEYHELGLLYIHYLMKSRGINVIYLGADVPLKDVEYVAALKKPDYLYTHLTCIAGGFSLDRFLHHLHHSMPAIPLVVSGQLTHGHSKKLPARTFLKRSLPEVIEYIATLA